MRAVNACSFPIFPHSAQNACSPHKWEEREGLIHVCQVHLEFLCHSLWRMEVDVTHILQKVKNIISWSATREQPWWLSIAGTVELLQRKAGTPSKHTHDSIENMLQILLPCYSWAEHTNHISLRSSSHSSSPALFPSALQLLQGAGRAMPGQHRSRAWAPSASPEQMEQCLCSCSELLSGRRTPAHWPGCHKLPGGKKGALLHTAARVCAVLALSAVEQSTGSQQGTPVLPGDWVLFSQSWGLCWQSRPSWENLSWQTPSGGTLSSQKMRGEAPNGGWGVFMYSCRCCTKATCLLCSRVWQGTADGPEGKVAKAELWW